jgi:hypothetical protein
VVIARFEGEGLEEADGTSAVGSQEYELPESTPRTDSFVVPQPPPPSSDRDPPSPGDPPKGGGLPLGLLVALIALGLLGLVTRCGAGTSP